MTAPTLDGSTSRTLIVLAALGIVAALCWHGKIDGQAVVGIVAAVLGGAVHASGTNQGAKASDPAAPPT